MMVKKDIYDLIRNQHVRIWYSFLPEGGDYQYVGELPVKPDEANDDATQFFDRQYFGDRLNLTLGPIVKSHGAISGGNRTQFKQFNQCYDLRASQNQIEMMPHEVMSIQTNERIALASDLGAIILPRLTNADSGLLYVPSYIDPFWDGLLQGVIVNLTNERQALQLGEGIAICRFYKLSGSASTELRDAFPAKSHHYANNWPRILDQDADPFPVRKRPVPQEAPSILERARRTVTKYKDILQRLGVSAGVVAVVFAAGTFYVKFYDLVELSKRQDDLERLFTTVTNVSIPAMEKSLRDIQVRHSLTGHISIPVTAEQSAITERVPLGRPISTDSFSTVASVGRQSGILSLSSRIEQGTGATPSTLVLVMTLAPDQRDRVIPLQWAVIE